MVKITLVIFFITLLSHLKGQPDSGALEKISGEYIANNLRFGLTDLNPELPEPELTNDPEVINIFNYFSWKLNAPLDTGSLQTISETNFGAVNFDHKDPYKIQAKQVFKIANLWFQESLSDSVVFQPWLKDGLLTYLSAVYFEDNFGRDTFSDLMNSYRNSVIKLRFQDDLKIPDKSINSGQEGAWILHMLRKEIGDDSFWAIIQNFYHYYHLPDHDKIDFIKYVDGSTEKNLKPFFNQWFSKNKVPVINMSWSKINRYELVILIDQMQADYVYKFPLELRIYYENMTAELVKLDISNRNDAVRIRTKEIPITSIVVDPNTKLLVDINKVR